MHVSNRQVYMLQHHEQTHTCPHWRISTPVFPPQWSFHWTCGWWWTSVFHCWRRWLLLGRRWWCWSSQMLLWWVLQIPRSDVDGLWRRWQINADTQSAAVRWRQLHPVFQKCEVHSGWPDHWGEGRGVYWQVFPAAAEREGVSCVCRTHEDQLPGAPAWRRGGRGCKGLSSLFFFFFNPVVKFLIWLLFCCCCWWLIL